MAVYSLVSRDPDNPGEIDLWHPERLSEEEFGSLVLESMNWTSSSLWHEQIFEIARYLVDKHGFMESGGIFRISYPAEWPKQKVQKLIHTVLDKDRSD